MKYSILTTKFVFLLCVQSICFVFINAHSIDWGKVDGVQAKLIDRYGKQKPVCLYAQTVRDLDLLHTYQQKESRNKRSGKLQESIHLTQDILKELSGWASRMHLVFSALENLRLEKPQQDEPEDDVVLPSFFSLLGIMRIAQEHVHNNQEYFTTPQVAPVQPQHPPSPMPQQPTYYQPAPMHQQYSPYNPYQYYQQHQWSPLEKFAGIMVCSVIIHGVLRWYFKMTIDNKVNTIGGQDEQLAKKLAKLGERVVSLEAQVHRFEELAEIKNDIKSISKQVKAETDKEYLDPLRKKLTELEVEIEKQVNMAKDTVGTFEEEISAVKHTLKNINKSIPLLTKALPKKKQSRKRKK